MRIENEALRVAAAFGVIDLDLIEFGVEHSVDTTLFPVPTTSVKVAAHNSMGHIDALAIYSLNTVCDYPGRIFPTPSGTGKTWRPSIMFNPVYGWREFLPVCYPNMAWFLEGVYCLGWFREEIKQTNFFSIHQLLEATLAAKERYELLRSQEREKMAQRALEKRQFRLTDKRRTLQTPLQPKASALRRT